jgi:hypothetical protein
VEFLDVGAITKRELIKMNVINNIAITNADIIVSGCDY